MPVKYHRKLINYLLQSHPVRSQTADGSSKQAIGHALCRTLDAFRYAQVKLRETLNGVWKRFVHRSLHRRVVQPAFRTHRS